MAFPETDTGVYVLSGLFAVVVFATAIAAMITRTGIDLATGTVVTLSVGFLGFISVYFVAWAVYHGIERAERSD